MNALTYAAEKRMAEAFEARMANLRRWFYGKPGEETCPCCFSTWIGTRFTEGWESLFCAECGAEGPLPIREVSRIGSKAKSQSTKKFAHPSSQPRQREIRLNVAW